MRSRKVGLEEIPGFLLLDKGESGGRLPRETAALVRKAVEQELTPRQRECVELYFFRRMTMEEVGEALGIGKATVCRHLQKSKRRLGRALGYAALRPPGDG